MGKFTARVATGTIREWCRHMPNTISFVATVAVEVSHGIAPIKTCAVLRLNKPDLFRRYCIHLVIIHDVIVINNIRLNVEYVATIII